METKIVKRIQRDDGTWLSDTELIYYWAVQWRNSNAGAMSNCAAFEILTSQYGISLSRRRVDEILHQMWGDGYERRNK